MTGFGRGITQTESLTATVEIKSVNHRYFEFACRMPRAYQFLEEKLKNLCQQSITRGKIELSVFIEEIQYILIFSLHVYPLQKFNYKTINKHLPMLAQL